MKRLFAIAAVCTILSCSAEKQDTMVEFELCAAFDVPTKLHLEGTDAPLSSSRYWKWSEDDALMLTYSYGGELQTCSSSSMRFGSDDGKYAFFTFNIPSSARVVSIEYGSDSAYGKTCDFTSDISGEMVFARASVSGEPGEPNLPVGVLQQCCSYLQINPVVTGKVVRSITVSGTGLTGAGSGAGKITIPLDKMLPFWVAVCNEAADVVVEAVDSGSGTTVLATLDDLGKGSCQMYEISYKPIIDYRQ